MFEVQDPKLPRQLALKLIDARRASDTAFERFWREADLLAKIQHRNVVRLFETGELPSGAYLVEELVAGESLSEVLGLGPLDPIRAARIARDLAGALRAVHAQGILHRDLKPGNVILGPDHVVLLDFGLARDEDAEQLTQTGAILGTPAYMSPEQAKGAKATALDVRTDVYGLGVLLYESITGKVPFTGPLPFVIYQILNEAPSWPSDVKPSVPAGLDSIVRKAMARNPDDRYASMLELEADLVRFLEGDAPLALATPTGRSTRWLLVVPVVLLVALGIGVTLGGARPTPPASDLQTELSELARAPRRTLRDDAARIEALASRSATRPDLAERVRALQGLLALDRGDPASALSHALVLSSSRDPLALALRGGVASVDSASDADVQAIQDLSEALEAGVQRPSMWGWRAVLRSRRPELGPAGARDVLADLSRTERGRPLRPPEHLAAALAQRALGDLDAASAALNRVEAPPRWLTWDLRLERAERLLGQPERAFELLAGLPREGGTPARRDALGQRLLARIEGSLPRQRERALDPSEHEDLVWSVRLLARVQSGDPPEALVAALVEVATRPTLDTPLALAVSELDSRGEDTQGALLMLTHGSRARETMTPLLPVLERHALTAQAPGERRARYRTLCLWTRRAARWDDLRRHLDSLREVEGGALPEGFAIYEAHLLDAEGAHDQAIELLERYLQARPDDSACQVLCAQILLRRGDAQAAVAAARRYVLGAFDGETEADVELLALVWNDADDRKPLLEPIEQVLARRPQHGAWRLRAALLQLEAGEDEAGRENLERALEQLAATQLPSALKARASSGELSALRALVEALEPAR